MKKTICIILVIILTILVFGGFIYFVKKTQEQDFNKFKNEIELLMEENQLTKYQEEKINYKIYEYSKSDFSTVEVFKVYTLNGFERYLKLYDYDFWYEIKIIFEV